MAELNGIKGLKCRRADTLLSEEQLKEIADLIYDSDPYIYPAMFTDRREAETVIPKMIRAGTRCSGVRICSLRSPERKWLVFCCGYGGLWRGTKDL